MQVGVFFDGTGNNKDKGPDSITNIGRLWSAYDERNNIKKLFVRGIGSDMVTDEDKAIRENGADKLRGLTTGYGGKSRVEYIFEKFGNMLDEYHDNHNNFYPHS